MTPDSRICSTSAGSQVLTELPRQLLGYMYTKKKAPGREKAEGGFNT